jgi:hypothetical protein
MTTDQVRSEPAVRLCDRCGRPLPALHRNEYTPMRADLVAAKGFCVCSPGTSEGAAVRIPDRAPSLIEDPT